MKLGVGIIIFSGVELLKPMILQLRESSHHIVGCFSLVSIEGTPAAPFVMPVLNRLLEEGLIDELVEQEFEHTDIPTKTQDVKREMYKLAKRYCKEAGCDRMLCCDTDEFFVKEELKRVIEYDEEFLISPIYDYVASPLYRSPSIIRLHVPFIHKMHNPIQPKMFPVLMDLSRTVESKSYRILREDELVMHHMTSVRYNETEFLRKFQGHSHFMQFSEEKMKAHINQVMAFKGEGFKTVEDQFGIMEYWNGEFKELYERYMK